MTLSISPERLQLCVNESEIRSVLARERFHRDHQEWDDWRKQYHPDASKTQVHTSLYHGDIDGFIAMTRKTPGSFFNSFHTVSPAVIDVKSNKALTKSLGTVNASFELEGRRYDCIVDVVMVTRLEFSTEGWRITTREAIYRRDRILPASPPELVESVNEPLRRSACRNIDWLAHHGGNSFDRNVLGFDRPEGVAEFLRAGREWLDGGE